MPKPKCAGHEAYGIMRPADVTADWHPIGEERSRGKVYLCWSCSEDRRRFRNVREL